MGNVLRDFHVLANSLFRCRGKVSGLEEGRSPNSAARFPVYTKETGNIAAIPRLVSRLRFSHRKKGRRSARLISEDREIFCSMYVERQICH
jgi:hypothetical protein